MSKTTNYILELESSGEVYFNEDEKQYVTTDRRRHPNADKIYGQGEATRDSLGEAGSGSVSIHPLRGQGASEEKTFCSEAGLLQTGEELSKVFQGGAGN